MHHLLEWVRDKTEGIRPGRSVTDAEIEDELPDELAEGYESEGTDS